MNGNAENSSYFQFTAPATQWEMGDGGEITGCADIFMVLPMTLRISAGKLQSAETVLPI
ncbi:hypothetical protein [Nitrosospira sp. Nsp1]|uniref:hypothetical protein n=1 Tax=Nitrosospira sp. Nsp1 TaxID=136547 RepID=UPI0015A0E73B|nr:hypothetical protein [Nitrosospira sp. Nsp1]